MRRLLLVLGLLTSAFAGGAFAQTFSGNISALAAQAFANMIFGATQSNPPYPGGPLGSNTLEITDGSFNLFNSMLYGWGGSATAVCINANHLPTFNCQASGGFSSPTGAASYTAGDSVALLVQYDSTTPWLQTVAGTFTATRFTPSSSLSALQISKLRVGEVIDTDDATKCSGIVSSWDLTGAFVDTQGFFQQGTLTACNPPSGTHATVRFTKGFAANFNCNLAAGGQQISCTSLENDCANNLGSDFTPALNGGRINCLDVTNPGANQASEGVRVRGKFYSGIDLSGATLGPGGVVNAPLATPGSSSSACAQGAIEWDAGFVYVCTATNTWKRATLAAF